MSRIALIVVIGLLVASCQSVTPRTWDLPPAVKTIEANGYEMAYAERGAGTPVVLVHGSLSDYRYWAAQMEPLGRTHRVIAVSLRHFYPEIWNGKGGDFSVEQHAKDLAVFIRRLNAGPAHLVGHSSGGDVALLLAKRNPELLRSLTLADPAPLDRLMPATAEAATETSARRQFVQAAIARLESNDIDGGLESFADGAVGAGAWKKAPEQLRAGARQNAWTIKALPSSAQADYACSDAAAISVPVLLITGEKSPRIYGLMLQGLAACLEHHKLAIIPNAAHTMNRMNPNAFNRALAEFLVNQR